MQILDGRNTDNYTSHGDMFSIHGAKMTPDRPHPNGWERSLPSERRAKPAGEWNHYRVTAQNGTLKLAVNGKEVSGGYDITPRKGYIHLESEGGVVDYRNIRIRELPSAGTLPPNQIAQADEGFVSLYTGTDFRGWQYPTGHEGHWVSKDWVIAYDGKSEAADKDLWTEKEFGDVAGDRRLEAQHARRCAADWIRRRRVAGAGPERRPARSVVKSGEAPLASRDPDETRRPPVADDRWRHRFSGLRDVPPPKAVARSAFGTTGAPIEFASIFVKE